MRAHLTIGGTPIWPADPDTLAALDEPAVAYIEGNRFQWFEAAHGALWFLPVYKVQVRTGELPAEVAA